MMNNQTRTDTNKPERPQQISFLLRLWCVDETGRSNWRASLETPETGQRLGFATLEQLFVYLLDFCEGRIDI
jgi:hypothetical protein